MGGKGPRRWLLDKVHLEARNEPGGEGCRRWRPASRRGEPTQGTCMKTVPGVGREHLQASRQACVRLICTPHLLEHFLGYPTGHLSESLLVPKCTIKCLFVFQYLLNWFWQKKIQIFKITEYWNYLMECSLFLEMCMPPTGSFPLFPLQQEMRKGRFLIQKERQSSWNTICFVSSIWKWFLKSRIDRYVWPVGTGHWRTIHELRPLSVFLTMSVHSSLSLFLLFFMSRTFIYSLVHFHPLLSKPQATFKFKIIFYIKWNFCFRVGFPGNPRQN